MSHYQNNSVLKEAERLIEIAIKSKSTKLDLSGLRIRSLPDRFQELAPQLETLVFDDRKNTINGHLFKYSSIQMSCLNAIKHCKNLKSLTLVGNLSLTTLEGIKGCSQIQELYLLGCQKLTSLDGLDSCSQLQILDISGSIKLTSLEGLNGCSQLQKLDISGCYNLTSLEGLNGCSQLKELDISMCAGINSLGGVVNWRKLQSINLIYGVEIDSLKSFENCSDILTNSILNGRVRTLFKEMQTNSNIVSFCLNNFVAAPTEITLKPKTKPLKLKIKLQILNISFSRNLSIGDIDKCSQLQELILPNCEAQTSLDFIKEWGQLQKLKLSDCAALTSLAGIKDRSKLKELDLSDCGALLSLDGIKGFSELKTLHIQNCESLKSLAGLKYCSKLQKLTLNNCDELTSLDGIKDCINLQELFISNCDSLKSLDGIKNCSKLQELQISHCDALTSLDGIKDCSKLQEMQISHCDALTSLDCIKDCSELKKLACEYCDELASLDGIKGCINLQELFISKCDSLKSIDGIKNCSKLQELQISHCDALTSLDCIKDCSELNTLKLENCENLITIDGIKECGQVQQLILNDLHKLTSLAGIESLNELKLLEIIDCDSLKSLDVLKNCSELNELALINCDGLTSLDGIRDFKQLHVLQLSNCRALTSLDCIKDCSELNTLKLENCENLISIDGIKECGQVQQLILNDLHKLTSLAGIESLNELKHLEIIDCKSLELRKCLGVSSKLIKLNIINSFIDFTLPFSFMIELLNRYPYLHACKLTNIRIKRVPHELTMELSSLKQLEDWYFDIQQGKVDKNSLKLHVIGNGRIGKTQLVRQLRGLSFDESIPSTHGIKINNWTLDSSDKSSTTVNSWDFGGQDVYLGTHSLFLDDNAVYCLLWHPDFENNQASFENGVPIKNRPLSYWLAYIHSLAGDKAPIIITQSHCDSPSDDREPPIPKTHNFSFLKSSVTSSKSENGLDSFLPILKRSAQYQFERNGETYIPVSWLKVLEKIEKDKHDDIKKISQSHYLDYCRTFRVSGAKTLLDYLHKTGDVFYKKNIFDDQIILDQEWALQGVYSLLERGTTLPLLKDAKGKFSKKMIEETLWSPQGYSKEEQTLFLEMMLQCNVCFKVANERYVAPDSLPNQIEVEDQINTIWREVSANIHIQLKYDFLHDSSMRDMLSSIGGRAGEHAVYWRYGCCFYDRDCKTSILISTKLTEILSEEEIENFGQPGIVDIKLNGVESNLLAKHLIDSILRTHHLGKLPSVEWLIGKEQSSYEKDHMMTNKVKPFSKIKPVYTLPKVYISYAWGGVDDQHQQVCDAIYSSLQTSAHILRDKEALKTGDSILEFEKEIGKSDHVIIILSAKSLESEDCMRELEFIYRRCLHDQADFTQRVIPIVLKDIKIGDAVSRGKYAKFWKQKFDELVEDSKGIEDSEIVNSINLYRNIKDCLTKVLAWSNDIVLTRNQQILNDENYQPLLDLVLQRIEETRQDK